MHSTTPSEVFEHVNNVLGAFSNAFLMYLIVRFSRKELGTYKNLLFAFAAFDIFLCALHSLVNPKIITVGTTFAAVASGVIESRYLSALFASSFTVPFSLMNIHFLYRFLSIRMPEKIELFSQKRYILLLVLYPTVQVVIWFFMSIYFTPTDDWQGLKLVQDAMHERYDRTVVNGYLILNHWKDGQLNVDATIVLVALFIVMCFNFTTATSLGAFSYYYISKTAENSFSYRLFQRSILIAVFAQTSVPVLFVYLPYSAVIFFPFFGLPDCHMPELFPVLTSIFPAWDALVIILLIKDYRMGLLTLLGRNKIAAMDTTLNWRTETSALASSITPIHQSSSALPPVA